MATISIRFAAVILCLAFIASCKKDSGNNNSQRSADSTYNNQVIETQQPTLRAVTLHVNDAIGGFYEILPSMYNQTNKRYPVLISLHGGGQLGNGTSDLPLLLNDGVPQLISKKTFPPNFNVKGQNFSFVILAPQFSYIPTNRDVNDFITYVKNHYRMDPSRFYLTGLSMGGIVLTDVASENSSQFAAIVPISGAISDSSITRKCLNIAQSRLPVWAFHNSDDPKVNSSGTVKFIDLINSYETEIPAKLTIFQSREHDAWTKAIDPGYRENNMNIFEWMLQYSR